MEIAFLYLVSYSKVNRLGCCEYMVFHFSIPFIAQSVIKNMKNLPKNLHGVYFTDVLTEMCKRVGADYEEIDFSEDGWYDTHSWTLQEKLKFEEWFAQYLRNMGPRREFCKQPTLVRTKPERSKFAKKFIADFAWKVKTQSNH